MPIDTDYLSVIEANEVDSFEYNEAVHMRQLANIITELNITFSKARSSNEEIKGFNQEEMMQGHWASTNAISQEVLRSLSIINLPTDIETDDVSLRRSSTTPAEKASSSFVQSYPMQFSSVLLKLQQTFALISQIAKLQTKISDQVEPVDFKNGIFSSYERSNGLNFLVDNNKQAAYTSINKNGDLYSFSSKELKESSFVDSSGLLGLGSAGEINNKVLTSNGFEPLTSNYSGKVISNDRFELTNNDLPNLKFILSGKQMYVGDIDIAAISTIDSAKAGWGKYFSKPLNQKTEYVYRLKVEEKSDNPLFILSSSEETAKKTIIMQNRFPLVQLLDVHSIDEITDGNTQLTVRVESYYHDYANRTDTYYYTLKFFKTNGMNRISLSSHLPNYSYVRSFVLNVSPATINAWTIEDIYGHKVLKIDVPKAFRREVNIPSTFYFVETSNAIYKVRKINSIDTSTGYLIAVSNSAINTLSTTVTDSLD